MIIIMMKAIHPIVCLNNFNFNINFNLGSNDTLVSKIKNKNEIK